MTVNVFQRAQKIIEAGLRTAKHWSARSQLESIQLYSGYAEPGYSDPKSGCVALGNWNSVSDYTWDESQFRSVHKTVDDTPARVAKLLERLGVELEWEDEWTSCEQCGKLFRTQPDSYSWQMAGVIEDGSCYCNECLDPVAHLESLEGQDQKCNTIDSINPEDHDYICVQGDFEHGFHPGQDADPRLIARALRKAGIRRFLFNLDSTGQFDMSFSVWVHNSEDVEKAQVALRTNPTDGPSVSEGLKRALQDASSKMSQLPDGAGVKYAQCDSSSGTAEVRLVSPEEFIRGIGKPAPEQKEGE